MATTTAPSSPTSLGQLPSKPIRRACDCCRKRKVRCDALQPCNPCKKAGIQCDYLTKPKKKGPKGLRSARVLHALRRLPTEDSAPSSPTNAHTGGNGWDQWTWASAGSTPVFQAQLDDTGLPDFGMLDNGPQFTHPSYQNHHDPYTSTSITPPAIPIAATVGIAHLQPLTIPNPYGLQSEESLQSTDYSSPMSHLSRSETGYFSAPSSAPSTQPSPMRLPINSLLPYIRRFFEQLYPVMPVLDSKDLLRAEVFSDSAPPTEELYCLLCALSAATIVQLDSSGTPFVPETASPMLSFSAPEDVLIAECLRERKQYDYLVNPNRYTIITSFFIFAYYGNLEKQDKAWYYLQEAISFAQLMELDVEGAMVREEAEEAQWRRRLYWLLFVTERAYAIQCRKHTRLHATIQLPHALPGEDPQLLHGFVNLIHLFKTIDDNFISIWRGIRRQSLCNEPWIASTQDAIDSVALVLENFDLTETQKVDIAISQQWLHVLAWQMGVSNGLLWSGNEPVMRLDYPVKVARDVVSITSQANKLALDSHGIGMEQKLCDIASCLADVLQCTAGDTSPTFNQGREYLDILLRQLSRMRGKESRYLEPLRAKVGNIMGYPMLPGLPPSFPVTDMFAGRRVSFTARRRRSKVEEIDEQVGPMS